MHKTRRLLFCLNRRESRQYNTQLWYIFPPTLSPSHTHPPFSVSFSSSQKIGRRFKLVAGKVFNHIVLAFFLQTPWNPKMEMPIEAASVHFLIGMCQSELGRRLGALDAFNNAIRVNPDYAEVKIYI